jgi:hypothetical protein
MANKKFLKQTTGLRILGIVLVFGMAFIGCSTDGSDPDPETATISISNGTANDTVLLTLSEGKWTDDLGGPDVFTFTKSSGDVMQPTNTKTNYSGAVLTVKLQVESGKNWNGTVAIAEDSLETLRGKTNVSGSLTIGTNTPVTVTASVRP